MVGLLTKIDQESHVASPSKSDLFLVLVGIRIFFGWLMPGSFEIQSSLSWVVRFS